MSIRRKINLTLGSSLCLTVFLAAVEVFSSWSARESLTSVMNEHVRAKDLSLEITHLATSALSQQRAIVARTVQADRPAMERYERQYLEERALLADRLRRLRAMGDDSGRLALIGEIEGLSKTWDSAHQRFWEFARNGQTLEMTNLCRSQMAPMADEIAGKLKRLVAHEAAGTRRAVDETMAGLDRQVWFATGAALLALAALITGVCSVRGGLRDLAGSLKDLRRMADEVTQASGSISGTSQALAEGATRQAASTEETAASSGEVKSMAQRNSDNAKQAATIVTIAQEKFDRANRSLVKLEETMAGIGASAGKIARIIKVIDDIAFQTNILSLNAAVEAARAGDAGMGFAVVAEEVRGLAQRCATAARETAELINESIANATEGKAAAGEVAKTIRSVTDETESIRTLVSEVSQGSEDQARAVDQIATAITQIERVTQDSAANAEEAAAASEQLTAQASELRHIMERLAALAGVGDEEPVAAQSTLGATPATHAPASYAPASYAPVSYATVSHTTVPRATVPNATASHATLSPRPASRPSPGAAGKMLALDDDPDFRPF